jgi:hypothetical protein
MQHKILERVPSGHTNSNYHSHIHHHHQITVTDFGTFALEIYITHLYLLQFSQINILFYIHSFLLVSNHFMSNVMTKGLHYSMNKMIAQC